MAGLSQSNGKRKFFYGHSRQEVARRLSIAQRDRAMGLPTFNDRTTVKAFLVEWLEQTVKPAVRRSTYTGYEVQVRCHILPDLGRIPLGQLGPLHVQRLLNLKIAGGLSPKTVKYTRQVLRTALAQAQRWGLIQRNVADLVDGPRCERREMKVFTTAEARRFLQLIGGDRLEALYSVALALGLRQGEALGLRWQDVDFEGAELHVRSTLQRFDGHYVLNPPKTAKSRRHLPLPASIAAALEAHHRRQSEERLLAGDAWQEWDLVFCTGDGQPLDHSSVTRRFQRLLLKSGLPRLRFHDLRHSCATLLLVQGVPARSVMEILGHSDISMTMNTYTHVLPELQREAIGRMEDFLVSAR